MNILLTGATGFLGYRTLEYLIELPYVNKIIATGRALKNTHSIDHEKVTYVLGDLTDSLFVSSIMNNIDVIINTASLSSPWGRIEQFMQANVVTQKKLIHYAQKNKVKRFIYISSPSIYYNGKDRFLVKEDDPLPKKFVNNYSKTKRSAEKLLENSKLNYIILRPRAIIGRGDSVIMPRLISAYTLGKLKIIGTGNNTVDLTSVKNVAHAIELSIRANDKACNQSYNITNGKPVFLWNYINKVIKEIGMKKIDKKVKFKTAYFAAIVFEFISKYITKKEPPLTKYSVGILSKSFTLDISKAKKFLNYKPIITTDDSLNEFVKWYKNE